MTFPKCFVFLVKMLLCLIPLLGVGIGAIASNGQSPLPPRSDYVGSDACQPCHQKEYNGWKNTFHSTAVKDAKADPGAILGDFSQPSIGFAKDEIEFTIGAHWNQRYMKKIGSEYYILPKSWSISSRKWENHNVWGWQKQPYGKYCIGCHTTRFDPTDKSYVEHKIGCEACHGPGKAHAAANDGKNIINPSKLGSVEMEMICASCHVRGKDPSGEYFFPVGFTPGKNLANYYVPDKMLPGEGISDAILRIFRAWWGNAGSEVAECEVCGIYSERDSKKPKSTTEYCMGCHKYGDKYSKHTNHNPKTTLECFDCHKKVEVALDDGETDNVHSISYFLVHKKTCYDKNYAKACIACHSTWSENKAGEWLSTWKGREAIHE